MRRRQADDSLLSETERSGVCTFSEDNYELRFCCQSRRFFTETVVVISPPNPPAQDEDLASHSPDSAPRSDLGPAALGWCGQVCWWEEALVSASSPGTGVAVLTPYHGVRPGSRVESRGRARSPESLLASSSVALAAGLLDLEPN